MASFRGDWFLGARENFFGEKVFPRAPFQKVFLGGECEHGFLIIVGLLFISLSNDKETNQRKRS
jgi:hypothetical protein